MHGEFTSLVDAAGVQYTYTQGNVPYLELLSQGSASAEDVVRSVEKRVSYLREHNSLRRNSRLAKEDEPTADGDLVQAFRLAQEYSLD